MKEIRKRFGEWYQKRETFFGKVLPILWVTIFFIGLYVEAGGIKVFTEYNEKDYIPLEDAVNAVVAEGMINLQECPDGIRYRVYKADNEQTTLTFSYLEEENTPIDKPYVHVTIENGKIKSISRNYYSKNSYIRKNLFNLIIGSFAGAMFFGGLPYSIILFCIELFAIQPEKTKTSTLSKPLGLYKLTNEN